jgi:hypothetical protein
MTEIKIVPAGPRDAAMHAAQYERLKAALEKQGYIVIVDVGQEVRTGVESVVAEIAIHIGEIIAADGALSLARSVRRFLRGLRKLPAGEPRRAVIYGPRGDVLATIELPEDEDDGSP